MDERNEKDLIRRAFETSLSAVAEDPWLAQRVLNQARNEGGKPMKRTVPRMIVILICLLALSISTAFAAGVISWRRGLEDKLRVTEETRNAYQHTELFDAPGLSVTQGDVTITLEQTIVDPCAAYLAFRVQGYQPPAGMQPGFASTHYAFDDSTIVPAMNASFFDGLVVSSDATAVYLDGSIPADYSLLPYTDVNGDLVYIISLFSDAPTLLGRTVTITLQDLGLYTDKWGELDVQAPGTWTFEWTLKGTDHHLDLNGLSLPIGDSGAALTALHLSPLHIHLTMTVPKPLGMLEDDDDDLFIPFFYGLKMQDGTAYDLISEAGMEGYVSPDPDCREYQKKFVLNRIIDPAQVASLVFTYPLDNGERATAEVNLR